MPGSKKTVNNKWEAAHKEFKQESMSGSWLQRKQRIIESWFNHLVCKQGAKNCAASRASVCGNTFADDMTEDEVRLVII